MSSEKTGKSAAIVQQGTKSKEGKAEDSELDDVQVVKPDANAAQDATTVLQEVQSNKNEEGDAEVEEVKEVKPDSQAQRPTEKENSEVNTAAQDAATVLQGFQSKKDKAEDDEVKEFQVVKPDSHSAKLTRKENSEASDGSNAAVELKSDASSLSSKKNDKPDTHVAQVRATAANASETKVAEMSASVKEQKLPDTKVAQTMGPVAQNAAQDLSSHDAEDKENNGELDESVPEDNGPLEMMIKVATDTNKETHCHQESAGLHEFFNKSEKAWTTHDPSTVAEAMTMNNAEKWDKTETDAEKTPVHLRNTELIKDLRGGPGCQWVSPMIIKTLIGAAKDVNKIVNSPKKTKDLEKPKRNWDKEKQDLMETFDNVKMERSQKPVTKPGFFYSRAPRKLVHQENPWLPKQSKTKSC
mmetsp:Transcript_13339/g.18619  ORF Transcript_13339/g.18619 Transcript_13339/m.18619 type:complete len:413 (-) Transcript_13339:1156-2394(-)